MNQTFVFAVNKEGMSRLPKRTQQAKRVAPPAVPEIYRHSGSSFGSAGYGSCEDGGGGNVVIRDSSTYYTTSDPNSSLNVSIRSNTSGNTSIDLPDSAPNRSLQVNQSLVGGTFHFSHAVAFT